MSTETLPPGTRVRTPRHGEGTVIDVSGAQPGIYDHWPVWVRMDDAEEPWNINGYEAHVLVVLP